MKKVILISDTADQFDHSVRPWDLDRHHRPEAGRGLLVIGITYLIFEVWLMVQFPKGVLGLG